MIPDWFVTIVYIFASSLMLAGIFFIAQLVIERFLISTLPVLAELYNRVKNPSDYK